ncbi:PREDICTED: uncharacterized protein K02A2.6-like [Gekko japonicus]|uniref:Gypsy retrotransposon integrase-like protein 1 n=1 Tax=Gekko japonicus TaxID=146911 RepID=A0ABM1JY29_GEKJA|nr:PREDICTED: uncharacterized protein K02A2.6-like [Gekko japonicus]
MREAGACCPGVQSSEQVVNRIIAPTAPTSPSRTERRQPTDDRKPVIGSHHFQHKQQTEDPRHSLPRRRAVRDGGGFRVGGRDSFTVEFKGKSAVLSCLIAEGNRTNLLGLDWFDPLGIAVVGVNTVVENKWAVLYSEFPEVFGGGLGRYNGPPVSFDLDPGVRPIRLKYRKVPIPFKAKIEAELDKLVEQGVLEPVPFGKWETPIVTPIKPDGSIRICADYKCTINKALQQHSYPVPVISHVLASLGGGKIFAKLDLAQAYQQLPVTKEAAEAQTIVTHRGAFRVNRLQFGVNVAPGIFQSLMEGLLRGVPGTVPYFDDVLIAGKSEDELLHRVREVLKRFSDAGLKVKKSKCLVGVHSVEFLGFRVDEFGVHPTNDKVSAIQHAPRPQGNKELQSFLGLLNFYHAFLPHKASVAAPLHNLLHKDSKWKWGPEHERAFKGVKELLSSDAVLTHYDENKLLVLAADASPYGVGAVLSHVMPDGREAPVAFYSRSLTAAEKNYAQIDKEALALVSAVKKFNDFLFGRRFILVTDHKPLLGIFAQDRQLPDVMSARMLRWALFLSAYEFDLEHRPGKAIGHADALSRCPLPGQDLDPAPACSVLAIEELPEAPVSVKDIAAATARDSVLSRVLNWVWRGWPAGTLEPEFKPYKMRENEMSVSKGCLLWGNRVVVPHRWREKVLKSLHEGHPGMVHMKALARGYVWWPGLDADIEEWVRGCTPCQQARADPPTAYPQKWESAGKPWSRLHIDLAGPHVTPCSATGRSPAELLMGRRLASLLDRLHPDLNDLRPQQQSVPSKVRTYECGDTVFAKNYAGGHSWLPATITEVVGSRI